MEPGDIVNELFEFMETDKLLNMFKLNSKHFTRKYKRKPKDLICFMLTPGFNNTTVELNKYYNVTGMEPFTSVMEN